MTASVVRTNAAMARRESDGVVSFVADEKGWFSDLDASLEVHLPRRGLDRVSVELESGDVVVRGDDNEP